MCSLFLPSIQGEFGSKSSVPQSIWLWAAVVSGVGFVFGSTQILIRKMALEGIFFIIVSFSWTVCEAQCTHPEGTMSGQEGTGIHVCSA